MGLLTTPWSLIHWARGTADVEPPSCCFLFGLQKSFLPSTGQLMQKQWRTIKAQDMQLKVWCEGQFMRPIALISYKCVWENFESQLFFFDILSPTKATPLYTIPTSYNYRLNMQLYRFLYTSLFETALLRYFMFRDCPGLVSISIC